MREDDLAASSLTENYLHRRDNATKYAQRAGTTELRTRRRGAEEDERPKRRPIVQGGVNKDVYTERALERERKRQRFLEEQKKAKEVSSNTNSLNSRFFVTNSTIPSILPANLW